MDPLFVGVPAFFFAGDFLVVVAAFFFVAVVDFFLGDEVVAFLVAFLALGVVVVAFFLVVVFLAAVVAFLAFLGEGDFLGEAERDRFFGAVVVSVELVVVDSFLGDAFLGEAFLGEEDRFLVVVDFFLGEVDFFFEADLEGDLDVERFFLGEAEVERFLVVSPVEVEDLEDFFLVNWARTSLANLYEFFTFTRCPLVTNLFKAIRVLVSTRSVGTL